MALDKDTAKKVLAQIDRNELAQLGCDLTSIPSPTGQEKAVAEFILNWFAANGIKAVRQDVEHDRPNAVGIVKGDGTGLSLGFNGHTDTSYLLAHGMHTDYAVCADGYDLTIVWTQTGVVQVKITTFGQPEAAWGTKRSAYPMEERNAIVKMSKIIGAIEKWGTEFEEKYI